MTRDFNAVIDSVNRRFGKEFATIGDVAAEEEGVFQAIRETAAKSGNGFEQIPIPALEREPLR